MIRGRRQLRLGALTQPNSTQLGSPDCPNHPEKYTDKYLNRTKRRSEATLVFGWGRKSKPQLSACSAAKSLQPNFASGKCKETNNYFVLYHHWQTWKTTHFSSISLHLIIMYGSNLSFPFYFGSWRIYQNVCRKLATEDFL